MRGGFRFLFFWKSVFLKHPNKQCISLFDCRITFVDATIEVSQSVMNFQQWHSSHITVRVSPSCFFVFRFVFVYFSHLQIRSSVFQWIDTFFAFVVFCISWDQEWNVWRPRFLRSRQFWSFTANTAFDWRHTKHIDVGNKHEISTSSLIEIPSPTRPGTLFASVTSLNIDIEWCFHIFFPTRNVLFGGGW